MGEVYWIKLLTNTFESESVMLLESMPEGDTILVIWFRMQILAGKCNAGGYLLLGNNKPYSDEMLATVFRRPLNTTRLAIAAFLEFGMVELVEGTYFLPAWELVQNTDGLQKIREQTRLRVERFRAKQKVVTLPVTPSNDAETTTGLEADKAATNDIRTLLSGTALTKVTDQDLSALAKRHGKERLLLAADVSAETLRRQPKEISNSAGYLDKMCGESLAIPTWYIPLKDRMARVEACKQRKASAEAEKAALTAQEEATTSARNAVWDSLSEDEQKKYEEAAVAENPKLSLPRVAITARAKCLAWEASLPPKEGHRDNT